MKSTTRVKEAAAGAGLDIDILTMPESTRTAREAASACGCSEAQIVKSLVFQKKATGELVLLLVAGDRQVDLERAGHAVGGELERADAKRVREVTGFAIGGVSPLGHIAPIPIFMDPGLLEHDFVWAAAGAPNAVFRAEPQRLKTAVSAQLLPAASCSA
ncbi:Cys-tRNA(Pro) deacylase, prolyl-tRNA editing enzyme YbaK/EbsC [Faunimonas pinastri]|uniref:Cys-tRNA(Pro) deacylase, prolyl-tRNA editing enzyme YbaK/EbsC n=1 Tax=Faunimonas pinastri TaxID=1855383 RepID=A0A1H9LCB8_9HYPH|nr:YbaK/EbsC family protein [Faunimonas pinastri]SER08879.1 Cys-tRNA(Pro) deacylase, prolyl-tRNA editing enzyme YbaK/EbsC [Faunimonas pinastri]